MLLIAEPYPTNTGLDFEIIEAVSSNLTCVEVIEFEAKTVLVRSIASEGSSMIRAKIRIIGKICDGEVIYRTFNAYATVNCTEAVAEPEEFTGIFMAMKGNSLYLHETASSYLLGISITSVVEDITDNSPIYLDSSGVIHCKTFYNLFDDLLSS